MKPFLHVVDARTRFQATEFLLKFDAVFIWHTFLRIWAANYVGSPESVLTYQGSVFMSKEWAFNCASSGMQLRHTGTESHNSRGTGENYHAILRQIYQKVRVDHKTLSPDLCLSLAVHAVNDTVGQHRLCHTLLVFGFIPKMTYVTPNAFPVQQERLLAMITARAEYEKYVGRALVNRGLRSIPPPAADHKYMPGDYVHVYREGLMHYTGANLIASVDTESIRIHLGERTGPRMFNIAQLRPPLIQRLESYDEVLSEQEPYRPRVLYSKPVEHGDPHEHLFDEAKRKELLKLVERGTFKLVLVEEPGDKPNIVRYRYVMSIKHSEGGEVKYKARYVLGGHRDRDKHKIVHNTVNIKQSSICTTIDLATILGFDVWSLDGIQSYIQSASKLLRKVFVRPTDLKLDSYELLQIIRPLYGLTDSGYFWCETFARFKLYDLRMQQSTGDSALFFRRLLKDSNLNSGTGCRNLQLLQKSDMKDTFLDFHA